MTKLKLDDLNLTGSAKKKDFFSPSLLLEYNRWFVKTTDT